MTEPQVWKHTPFHIERKEGKTPSTVIFSLSGPFTARDMYGYLTPAELQNMLDFKSVPGEEPPLVNIIDLTNVPYVDSAGLGVIITQYVRCQNRGIRMVVTNVSPRVHELFRMTRVDGILPVAATVEEIDIP